MNRTCPECSARFETRSGRKRFCKTAHKLAFERRQALRGKMLVSLAQVARNGKRGRTDATAWAFMQQCKLLDAWNADDRAAGRRPELIVADRMASGWNWADAVG